MSAADSARIVSDATIAAIARREIARALERLRPWRNTDPERPLGLGEYNHAISCAVAASLEAEAQPPVGARLHEAEMRDWKRCRWCLRPWSLIVEGAECDAQPPAEAAPVPPCERFVGIDAESMHNDKDLRRFWTMPCANPNGCRRRRDEHPPHSQASVAPAEPAEPAGTWLMRLGTDGRKWARSFRATAARLGYGDIDEDWLIGWFCNAVMVGWDGATRKAEARIAELEAALAKAEASVRDAADTTMRLAGERDAALKRVAEAEAVGGVLDMARKYVEALRERDEARAVAEALDELSFAYVAGEKLPWQRP